MHVREIYVEGFMRLSKAHVRLPESGVVLITGDNGSGKSSLVESVAVGTAGKTLRGTPPWRDGEPGLIQLRLGDLRINRKKPKSGAVRLQYGKGDDKLNDYTTGSKAQADLNKLVQDWEAWKRTSVFRADEAGAFTEATDSQRKQLIESLTGTARFDPALKLARDDRKDVDKKVTRIERDIAVLEERLAGYDTRLADLEEDVDEVEIPDLVDPEVAQAKANKYEQLAKNTKEDIRTSERQLTDAKAKERDGQAALRAAEKQAARLDVDDCPTCEQPIPEETRATLRDEVEAQKLRLTKARETTTTVTANVEAEVEELEEELESLELQGRDARDDVRTAKNTIRRIAEATKEQKRREGLLEKGREARTKAAEELVEQEDKLEDLQAERAELAACEKVLGVQGVRSHILGRGLSGIETIANAWLARIGWPGLAIRLLPYSEKKSSDAVSDKISMKLEGAGGGYGYKAASRGERRRVDVALILALGEYAAAAQGVRPGTLWMDEILDGLDDEGVEAVSDAVQDLAKERAVVIISHREELCSALRPALHLHVEDGVVTSLGSSVQKAS